jgi:FixJ family two-component response regulator
MPFASAEDFLVSDALANTQCLILDVSMPGMSGPELQCELSRRDLKIPIIFITAHCDRDLRADLLARGAVECLSKPFSEDDLRGLRLRKTSLQTIVPDEPRVPAGVSKSPSMSIPSP